MISGVRRHWLLVAATLILIALTLAAFNSLERYQPTGEVLLPDPPFSTGFDGWAQNGQVTFEQDGPGQVMFENDDPKNQTSIRRTIDLPPGQTLALLEAIVSIEDVIAGEKMWQRARIFLAQLDQQGKPIWKEPHNLFTYEGTRPSETISKIFPIPSSIEQVWLSLELNDATGRMVISDLKLDPVEETPIFRHVSMALMVAWAVLVVFVAFKLFKSVTSIIARLALGVIFALFVVGLFIPAPLRNALIEALPFPSAGGTGIEPDMVGHGIVFAIMAFLVRVGQPGSSFQFHFGCWVLIAIVSEVLQLFTVDREPSALDFAVDVVGIVLGLTLAQFLRGSDQGSASKES